jgi:hypothetical protein
LTLIIRMGQGAWYYNFWFGRPPILCLWMAATNRHLGCPRCTAKLLWRSVEAHFQNGAEIVLFTLLPRKAACILIMDSSDYVTIQLPYLQDLKPLMLHWRSFSGCGREPGIIIFDLEGIQYLVYKWMQPIGTWVIQAAQPKVVEAALKLIFRMGQWSCRWLCCQKTRPVGLLQLVPTTSPFNYCTYKTENHWRSF